MKREYYLQGEVTEFTDWLAERLCGHPIKFSVPGNSRSYQTLADALNAYCWPLMAVAGRVNPDEHYPYIHPLVPRLPAKSNLAANAVVLGIIQEALRGAYHNGSSQINELAGAVAAVLHWGGVYTTTKNGGNKPWLQNNYPHLLSILEAVVNDHARDDDRSEISDLRFNSGMTKIYSLLIDDFIIYDSRVAASLAWLVLNWWVSDMGRQADKLPEQLRFGCLMGNGKAQGHRNPEKSIFRTISSRPGDHYMWNVRANWILASAHSKAGTDSKFGSLREIEAALFQMGERVV